MSEDPLTNVLLNNRRKFTARQSMEALLSYARDQDQKIYVRAKRFQYGRAFAIFAICSIPFVYFAYSISLGSWRSIYHSSFMITNFQAIQNNPRQYFVPQMYLKEREIRKIQLGLKDSQQLRSLYGKKKQ